jgi:hypothetical protein
MDHVEPRFIYQVSRSFKSCCKMLNSLELIAALTFLDRSSLLTLRQHHVQDADARSVSCFNQVSRTEVTLR